MDRKTVKQLSQLNQRFYLRIQEYFNRTRQSYWLGWEKLLPLLQKERLRVLDIGCGNGRLGRFLAKRLPQTEIEYVGLDNNRYLLSQAKKALPQAKLIKQDILRAWALGGKEFELIAIMGVLHHLPGFANRLKLLERAKQKLAKNGFLVFTIWQFTSSPKLSKKIISWEEFKQKTRSKIDFRQLEPNDYILDWKKGVKGYRFCHLINQTELKKLTSTLKMKLFALYLDDDREKGGNEYVVLKKS
jgi:tRNA (uracil-5-)-methyltransferase TRM9